MNIPKTLAKIGSVYIEEAILAVLEGAEGLLPGEISDSLMRLFSASLQNLNSKDGFRIQSNYHAPHVVGASQTQVYGPYGDE